MPDNLENSASEISLYEGVTMKTQIRKIPLRILVVCIEKTKRTSYRDPYPLFPDRSPTDYIELRVQFILLSLQSSGQLKYHYEKKETFTEPQWTTSIPQGYVRIKY